MVHPHHGSVSPHHAQARTLWFIHSLKRYILITYFSPRLKAEGAEGKMPEYKTGLVSQRVSTLPLKVKTRGLNKGIA